MIERRESGALRALLVAGLAYTSGFAGQQSAGHAKDQIPLTFTFGPAAQRQLKTVSGKAVAPSDIPKLYGQADGFRILVDGVDVCSWDYARARGFSKPRRPVYQDLSDATGWPDVHVRSGTVAIDPRTGRFRFAEGDTQTGIVRENFLMTPHGMTHRPTVRGHYMYCPNGETWSGVRVVDIADPANPKCVMTLDVGCFGKAGSDLGDRMYCHTNYNGTTILDLSDHARPKKIGHWRLTPNAHHGNWMAPFKIGDKHYVYCHVRGDENWKDTPPQPRPGAESRVASTAGRRSRKDERKVVYEADGKYIVAKAESAELTRLSLGGEVTSLVLSADKQFLYAMVKRKTLALVSCAEPKAMTVLDKHKVKAKPAAVYAAAKPYTEARLNQACLNAPGCFVAEYEELPGRPTGFVSAFEIHDSKLKLAWSMQKFPTWGLRLVDVTDPAKPVTRDLGLNFMLNAVHGTTAYRAVGKETYIYDISKPGEPRELSRLPQRFGGLTFVGDKLYAFVGKDLTVFDNREPAAPKLLGKLADANGGPLAVHGKYAYFVSKRNTVTAVDVSDPANMKLLGSATIPHTKTARAIALRPDGKVAIVADEVAHWLFDLTDPGQPKPAGTYFCAGELQHLLVDHQTSIATTCTEWGGLQVMVDLSDPLKAKILGYYHSGRFDDYADVFRDGWMYFSKRRKDTVVDCRDPSRPKVVGEYEPEEAAYFPVRFWANTGYTIGGVGREVVLTVYDYADARHPRKLGRVVIGHRCHALASNGKLLLALGKAQLTAVDVSAPATPRVTGVLEAEDIDRYGNYSWQGSGRRIAIAGNYAYSIQGSEGHDDPRIAVYDITDPAAVKRIYVTPESRPTFQDDWFDCRVLHQGDMFNDMIIEGRYMYVSDYWGGVRVYDLADPAKPVCVDFEFEPYYALVPDNWSRAEYRKACASGDVEKYFGITPQTWAKRFEIGRKLSWIEMEYHPGYELFAWNIGELVSDYLVQPKLGGLAVYRVKRTPEAPRGRVTVECGR